MVAGAGVAPQARLDALGRVWAVADAGKCAGRTLGRARARIGSGECWEKALGLRLGALQRSASAVRRILHFSPLSSLHLVPVSS